MKSAIFSPKKLTNIHKKFNNNNYNLLLLIMEKHLFNYF